MSRFYAAVVERFIATIKNRDTRKRYKTHLRAIFRALEGRDAATDSELFYFPYNRYSEYRIRTALQQIDYNTAEGAISVYRGIIQLLVTSRLLERDEAANLIEDHRVVDEAKPTTKWLPVDAALPEDPTTHPYADTSRWYRSEMNRYPAAFQQISSKGPDPGA